MAPHGVAEVFDPGDASCRDAPGPSSTATTSWSMGAQPEGGGREGSEGGGGSFLSVERIHAAGRLARGDRLVGLATDEVNRAGSMRTNTEFGWSISARLTDRAPPRIRAPGRCRRSEGLVATGDRALTNFGVRLSGTGRREGAPPASQEAVAILRGLEACNPDAYRPELATALRAGSQALANPGTLG